MARSKKHKIKSLEPHQTASITSSQPPSECSKQEVEAEGRFLDLKPEATINFMAPKSILPILLPQAGPKCQHACCTPIPNTARIDHFVDYHDFHAEDLAWAIQSGLEPDSIERYLQKINARHRVPELNRSLKYQTGAKTVVLPLLAFAVERNCPRIIRALCAAGASPNGRMQPHSVPLIAYAVLISEYEFSDTTNAVMALLAMGADPKNIPSDMWEEPVKAPRKDAEPMPMTLIPSDGWCVPEIRKALARSLIFSQRYGLYKAANMAQPTERMLQVAKSGNITSLFEVLFHIIGQQGAIKEVLDSILDHYLFKRQTPLTMFFTGLSGHGKTELAKQMGCLLSLPIQIVDCTTMRRTTDMFGPSAPYQGYEEGSPLNNYLASHSNKPIVVFLDEFDKTTEDVRNAFLLPFESGFYEDRRDKRKIDCSKTIWILAGNIGTQTISDFWDSHMRNTTEQRKAKAPFHQLQERLQLEVVENIGGPLAGRLSRIIPYVPFDDLEMAAVAYKFMKQAKIDARKDIDVEKHQVFRHLVVSYVDDGKIASSIAKQSYVPQLGARSLQMAVQRMIERNLSSCFLGSGKMVTDAKNSGPLESYEVRLIENEDLAQVEVSKAESKVIQRREEI
ncbi:uncharacterized protein KY384_005453 [Bacidia gigantensis]|uniref:uncharacterized protein n=1 Tax=Bacidia gigantensis TaxID=2732470 RepID=UPI001D036AE1|nr:uncharacterized protein KY384_005453 [Bacidia gigantensis]KAG8529971.1 hypothetical protein KY384_005453 [Bacidia gigantensis]